MIGSYRLLARLLAVLATVATTSLLAATRAAAAYVPGPDGAGSSAGSAGVLPPPTAAIDHALSTGQWLLFAAIVLVAVGIGAALAGLARRYRTAHLAQHGRAV